MKKIKSLNCKKINNYKRIQKGLDVNCECGCQQRCLDTDEYISRWRVMNPFSFEDKRSK